MIRIEDFTLPEPDNYNEIVKNADNLFANLLIKYYFDQRKSLTKVKDNGKLFSQEANNGELHIS